MSSSNTVFVGGFPSNVRESEIQDLFTKFGEIKRCEIKPHPRDVWFGSARSRLLLTRPSPHPAPIVSHPTFPFGTCRPYCLVFSPILYHGIQRGMCFVEFNTEEEADNAVREMAGHELDGTRLRIELAKPQRAPRECYNCGKLGHISRFCSSGRRGGDRYDDRRGDDRRGGGSRYDDRRGGDRYDDRRGDRSDDRRGGDRRDDRRSGSGDRYDDRRRRDSRSRSRGGDRGRPRADRSRSRSRGRRDEPRRSPSPQ
ncbi:hypothetical protein IWQ60_010622 [Tieghemiomyces parasiticus]|uniref:Uncharacterized protein n=1 Tax=Tieghemiomyces parasiticus TaxID=78921 RepID=A0A9W8DJE4_9FUNG|nr:hypothetical protein IWQ60_010622 [Tieghemiomyces parasiticus]